MKISVHRIAGISVVCGSGLAMLLFASAGAQETGGLEACAKLEDPQARLECYDAASQRQRAKAPESQPNEEAAANKASNSDVSEQPAPASDAAGDEKSGSGDEKDEPLRATLTDCREGPTGKWYFYLDNGEVWEQRDNDRFSKRYCSGEVTISKDFFGYKIKFQTTANKIRAGRVR